ncbi:MAG TPA: SDR family oxidoreductase [Thermoanaerobaculia bacterium]|jgi:short-subunit dehydrogenase|nr:SDR family oxidoreductase [Thermoanaerobaculia bacterium]
MKLTALITGPSSGIGLDLAHLFAADGHDVVLVARSEGKLRELAAELSSKHNVKATVIVADLTRPDAPREIFAASPAVDILVNNAGFGTSGHFAETTLRTELDMLQVNIAALTHLTKLFLPQMLERKRGRILNVASTASFQPGPLMAVYYATKAYVLSFSEAVAEELRGTGVTLTTLCPGPTATEFQKTAKLGTESLLKVMKPVSSMEVARAGYRGLMRGQRVVIPGVKNKFVVQSLRVTPRAVVTRVVRALQERR